MAKVPALLVWGSGDDGAMCSTAMDALERLVRLSVKRLPFQVRARYGGKAFFDYRVFGHLRRRFPHA